MKVYKLTSTQKSKLVGVKFSKDTIYNPIQDGNGIWIISEGEVEQTIDENFLWVKDLPQIDYVKPKEYAS
jgi:hypothetical protein